MSDRADYEGGVRQRSDPLTVEYTTADGTRRRVRHVPADGPPRREEWVETDRAWRLVGSEDVRDVDVSTP